MQGGICDPSLTFRAVDLAAPSFLPWDQNPVALSSPSLHTPIIPSHVEQRANKEVSSSDRSRHVT